MGEQAEQREFPERPAPHSHRISAGTDIFPGPLNSLGLSERSPPPALKNEPWLEVWAPPVPGCPHHTVWGALPKCQRRAHVRPAIPPGSPGGDGLPSPSSLSGGRTASSQQLGRSRALSLGDGFAGTTCPQGATVSHLVMHFPLFN